MRRAGVESIPGYLSDKIESIQKRALKIIFLCADSYPDALEFSRVETLAYRRDKICKEYMCKMKGLNHHLHPLLPTRLDDTCPHTLRHKSDEQYFYRNVTSCRTKRSEDFFTFKVTPNLRGCLPEKNSYARWFLGNHRKLYINKKVIKCRIR